MALCGLLHYHKPLRSVKMTSRFLAFMLAVMSIIHATTTHSPPHNWLIAQQEANQLLFQLITSKQPRPTTPWASPLNSLKTAKSSPRGLLGSSSTTRGIRIHSPGVLAFEHLMLLRSRPPIGYF